MSLIALLLLLSITFSLDHLASCNLHLSQSCFFSFLHLARRFDSVFHLSFVQRYIYNILVSLSLSLFVFRTDFCAQSFFLFNHFWWSCSSCNSISRLFLFLSLSSELTSDAQSFFLFNHFWWSCSSCNSISRLFLFQIALTALFLSLNIFLDHISLTHVELMTSRRYDEVMKHTRKHLTKYYKQMKKELNVLTLTQRVYANSSENLQSWIKNLWCK